jgi:hypothetical protein
LLDELRLGVSCLDTQLDDLLRAAAPSFHKAAPTEGFREEGFRGRDRWSRFKSSTLNPNGRVPSLQISRRSS